MRRLSEIEADDAVTLPNVVMRAQAWVDRRDLVSALREAMVVLGCHEYVTAQCPQPGSEGAMYARIDALRERVKP